MSTQQQQKEEEEEEEILSKIADENLQGLLELYKKHNEKRPHVVSLIGLKIEWARQKKGAGILNFYTPRNSPKQFGTFIAIQEIDTTYDVFAFTLSVNFDSLRDALHKTKVIQYGRIHLFSMVHPDLLEMVKEVSKSKGVTPTRVHLVDTFTISRETAANFKTTVNPPGTRLKKLHPSCAGLINSVWPVRYENSEKCVRKIIELNGGYGVFLEETGELVSWVVKTIVGQIGFLQTVKGHSGNGYAAALVRAISKEIAQEGNDPFATVDPHNGPPQTIFKKLGFAPKSRCYYVNYY